MNKLFFIICALFSIYSSSSYAGLFETSEATHILQGNDRYDPIKESDVTVFIFKPDFPFKVIGAIEARGMAMSLSGSEDGDVQLAMEALKKEAAKIGANGVVIIRQGQVKVPGTSSDTERRIYAAAIKY